MTTAHVFNDLCRFPKWSIDNITVVAEGLRVGGWALPFRDDLGSGQIAMNGERPKSVTRGGNAGLSAIFPYLENAEFAPFTAVFEVKDPPPVMHFSYVGAYSREPFNRWMDIYFPFALWNEKRFVGPDAPRLKRTQGNESLFRYVTYGHTVANQLNLALLTYFGKTLGDYKVICDWGAGCGRVAQMVRHLAPQSEIIGIDVDADNIAWCAANLKFANFKAIGLYPPTDIADSSVDCLYGISVFTHLKLEAFQLWIEELARILRPGGVALVTINGGAGLMRQGGTNAALIERVLNAGFDDGSPDGAISKQIAEKDYYRGTFVMHRKAVEMFSAKFKVRDILRQANGASQDMMVCERI